MIPTTTASQWKVYSSREQRAEKIEDPDNYGYDGKSNVVKIEESRREEKLLFISCTFEHS